MLESWFFVKVDLGSVAQLDRQTLSFDHQQDGEAGILKAADPSY
jgi:hypothetical protein